MRRGVFQNEQPTQYCNHNDTAALAYLFPLTKLHHSLFISELHQYAVAGKWVQCCRK